jgi:hypothetical protein
MMEALVCHPLGKLCIALRTIEDPMANNVFFRHNQGPHAAFAESSRSWCMSNFHF